MTLRYRVCPDCGFLHDVSAWPGNHRFWNEVLCAPSVHRDGLDDLWHPVDNKLYDSKSNFRKTTKQSGGDEVGNELQKSERYDNTVTFDQVAEAYNKVSQGYIPSVADGSDLKVEGYN